MKFLRTIHFASGGPVKKVCVGFDRELYPPGEATCGNTPQHPGLAPMQLPPGFLLPREGFLAVAAALGPPYAPVTKRALGGGGTYRGSTAGHT